MMLVPPTTLRREIEEYEPRLDFMNRRQLREYWYQYYTMEGNRVTVIDDMVVFGVILADIAVALELPEMLVIQHGDVPSDYFVD